MKISKLFITALFIFLLSANIILEADDEPHHYYDSYLYNIDTLPEPGDTIPPEKINTFEFLHYENSNKEPATAIIKIINNSIVFIASEGNPDSLAEEIKNNFIVIEVTVFDQNISTPEGIKVGDSFSRTKNCSVDSLRTDPENGSYIELPSGWRAYFFEKNKIAQRKSNSDSTGTIYYTPKITDSSRVKYILKK